MNINILPINFLQYNISKISPIYNPNYVNNLIGNGIVSDYFSPITIAQNPLFQQVNNLNENIGILQTATNGIDKILNYIDILKSINPDEKKVINDLVNEINTTIKNTTFNSTSIFNQTLKIGTENIYLSIPLLDLNKTTIEDYEKFLTQKKQDIFNILKNISINLPIKTTFNPFNTDTFENLLNSGELTTAYKKDLINPYTLQLLFS